MDVARGTDHVGMIARENGLALSRLVTIGHAAGGHVAIPRAAASEAAILRALIRVYAI